MGHFGDSEYDRDLEKFDPVADVAAFHSKFGLKYDGGPRLMPDEIAAFRGDFMWEELEEYFEARDDGDQAKMLDALVDLTYVVLGNAYLQGYDFREAWRRVHAANMAKVRAASAAESKRGNAHDVVKPPGWVAPDLTDLVAPSPPDPDKYFNELIGGPACRADETPSDFRARVTNVVRDDGWDKKLMAWIRAVHEVIADGCKGSCSVQRVEYADGVWSCTFGGYCIGNLNRIEVVRATSSDGLVAEVKQKITSALQSDLDDKSAGWDRAYLRDLEHALLVAAGDVK